MTEGDREWFAQLLYESEQRTNNKIDQLHSTDEVLKQELANVARKSAGDEGKKWASILGIVTLISTLVQAFIVQKSQPDAPAPQHTGQGQ